ncbi:hypothetical protein AB0M43_37720 [Longispora sp. NPDC051575]|uniref:hypothetical protein n=1 Tax=Longispora sp. NPDC051575 TaxID=3154943 RepID=UPI00341D4880
MTKIPSPRPRMEGSLADQIGQRARARDEQADRARLDRDTHRVLRDGQRLLGPSSVDRRGGFGVAAGRASHLLKVPPLVTTSAQLCSVFPFVHDPPLPVDGALVGMEVYSRAAFTFSIHELYRAKLLTSPNAVITGEIGSAKSSLLKTLAFRGIPFGTRYFVVDVKGEYGALAQLSGIRPLRIGPGLGVVMNPLASLRRDTGLDGEQWRQLQRSRRLLLLEGLLEIQLGGPLEEAERSLLEYALDAVVREDDGTSDDRLAEPTLSAVLAAMGDERLWLHRLTRVNYDPATFASDSRRVRLALERLISGSIGGIFDGETIGASLDFDQPGAVLNLQAVRASDQMTAMALSCAQSWLESELARPDAPPRVCLYDEFALITRHLALVRRMREQMKLARALGIANILAFHRFSDLMASGDAGSEAVRIARGLIEDSGVRVSYRQAPGSLESAQEFLGTTDVETRLLTQLRQGIGLWRIGSTSYVVKHQLSPEEREMVHTDSRMETTDLEDLSDAEYDERLEAAATGTVGGRS